MRHDSSDSTRTDAAADGRQDGAGFEAVEDPARELFALPEPLGALRGQDPAQVLERVLTLDHDVPLREGGALRVHEHLTLRSWLRQPKRAVLFLGGTALTAGGWSAPVEGYDGPGMAAQRGAFAFTVDFLGVGDHYRPGADALDSTFERNLEALTTVLRYVRFRRAVDRVDLVGESWGAAHATQLAADVGRVRSCVMSSATYKTMANPMFTSPEFVGFLRSLADNYLPTDPAIVESTMPGAPEAVKTHLLATQIGPRLTTQLWQIIEGLPHFDPSVARVPGLVVSGQSEAADGRALAADYGTDGAQFFEIEGGAHVPRLGSPDVAQRFWDRVFRFIDP